MYKNFHKWNNKKISIHQRVHSSFFKEREIWFASLGCNVGHEEDGKGRDFQRPVIILTKFNAEMFWGIPLTTKIKSGNYFVPIEINNTKSVAILSQLKVLDSKRLIRRIGKLTENETHLIKNRLYKILFR